MHPFFDIFNYNRQNFIDKLNELDFNEVIQLVESDYSFKRQMYDKLEQMHNGRYYSQEPFLYVHSPVLLHLLTPEQRGDIFHTCLTTKVPDSFMISYKVSQFPYVIQHLKDDSQYATCELDRINQTDDYLDIEINYVDWLNKNLKPLTSPSAFAFLMLGTFVSLIKDGKHYSSESFIYESLKFNYPSEREEGIKNIMTAIKQNISVLQNTLNFSRWSEELKTYLFNSGSNGISLYDFEGSKFCEELISHIEYKTLEEQLPLSSDKTNKSSKLKI